MTGNKWEIGLDGWPVDPSHPCYKSPKRPPLEEFIERQLAMCEHSWKGGNFPALLHANALCARYNKLAPPWLIAATRNELLEKYDGKKKGNRGQTANPKAVYLNNWRDYDRWATVVEIRERRQELQELGYETSWADDKIYQTASDNLKGQPGEGSASAVRFSYLKVQKAFKEGNSAPYTLANFGPPK